MLALKDTESRRIIKFLNGVGPYVHQEGRRILPLFKTSHEVARVIISRNSHGWADNPPTHVVDVQLDKKRKPIKIISAVNTRSSL